MPGGGIHLRSTHALEQELQCELNESWGVELAVDDAETAGRWPGAAGRVRRAKLDPIERIEELCPELQTEFILRANVRRLEYREVPVIDPRATKRGVNSRFVAETPLRGS